jgi:hypothetical protein
LLLPCVVRVSLASISRGSSGTTVTPFAWGEVLPVCAAVLAYARHAADSERGRLAPRLMAAGEQDLKLK